MQPDNVATLFLRPSVFERDRRVRQALTATTHTSLLWGGAVGVLGALLYGFVNTLILDQRLVWGWAALGPDGGDIAVTTLLIIAMACGMLVALARLRCSLAVGRLAMSLTVLACGAAIIVDGALEVGRITDYLGLLYLVGVAAVPFRPWQVFGIGLGLTGLIAAFGIPDPVFGTVGGGLPAASAQLTFLSVMTLLLTGISAVLYVRHYDRVASQAKLEAQRDLFTQTEALAQVGGWTYDVAADRFAATPEVYRIYGADPEDEFDLEAGTAFYPDDALHTLQAAFRRCLVEETPFEVELPLHRADTGTKRWVHVRGRPHRGPDGQVTEVVGAVQDVTERREMDQELREREGLLRSINENVSEGLYRSTPEEGIVYANPALAHLFGFDSAEAITDVDLDTLYVNPDRRQQLTEQLHASGKLDGVEVHYRRQDGSTFVGRLTSTVSRSEDGAVLHYDNVVADITERKKAEEALEEERDRLLTLFDALPVPVVHGRPHGGAFEVLTSNPAFEEVFGFTLEPGANLHDTIVPDDRHAEAEQVDAQLVDQGAIQTEVRRQTASGALRDFRVVASTRQPADGAMEAYAVYVDITERRRMEQELRKRKAQLRGLIDSIPGMVYQFRARPDGTYDVPFASEAADDILGLSAERDDFFERLVDRVPESHREDFLASIDEVVAEGAPWRFEMPYERPAAGDAEAERRWLLGTSTPERHGDTLLFNGVLLDITERKRKEERVRVLSAAVEQANDGILVTDAPGDRPDGGIVYVNEAFEAMTGYQRQELEDETAAVLRGPETDSAVIRSLRKAQAEGRAWEGETTNYRKDGTPYVVQWTAAPVRSEVGRIRYWVSVQRDVTDRKRYEHKLQTAKEEAEQAARLRSAMLANMSHEIRTPLTSIIGFAEVLEDQLDGQAGHFAELITRSSNRLMETLDSVLQLSKLDAGAYTLDRTTVDLRAQVTETVEMLAPKASKNDLTLETDLPDHAVSGSLDKSAVNRILSNLVGNAVKFTEPDGTVTVRLSSKADSRSDGRTAVLEVEDTGIGISADLLPNIFQAFRQESEGISRSHEGSGLGLTIVQKLVDAHGGTIDVESEKGVGSRFTVRLPLDEAARA